MANGDPFDPDQFTAASWFFPLGTIIEISLAGAPARSLRVTVTDRGPAKRLVQGGRIIDLSYAAFKSLADPRLGLTRVVIRPLPTR